MKTIKSRHRHCSYCSEELKGEDLTNPMMYDGEPYCERCYGQECEGQCDRCGNFVVKDEVAMRPGELLAFWEETNGLKPGYYRVLRWPIYMDGMITGFVLTDNLQFVLPLDDKGKLAAKDAWTPGGSLCLECRTEIQPT